MRHRRILVSGLAGMAVTALAATSLQPAQATVPLETVTASVADRAAQPQGKPLKVTTARALDDKSFEIRFNSDLNDEIRTFVDGNPAYLAEYIRVAGGTSGESDAALDGKSLDEIDGTRVYRVDGNPRALRVVLGDGTALQRAKYRVWLDGAGHDLSSDLLIRGKDGATFRDGVTRRVSLSGSADAAEKAALDGATATDARTLRVVFADSVLDGMPASRYDASGIVVDRADGSQVSPVYVQAVAGTDRTTWDLTFAEDLGAGSHEVRIDGAEHRLLTSGGRLGDDDAVSATFNGQAGARSAPSVSGVRVDEGRERIVVSFDRKIDAFNGGAEPAVLAETDNGTGGSTVERDVLLDVVDITGAIDGSGTIEENLERVAAYAPDLRTLVIKLERGVSLGSGSRGSITLADGAVTDLAGVASEEQQVSFKVPKGADEAEFDASGPDYLKVDRDASVKQRVNAFEYTDPPNDYSVRPQNVENRLVDEEQDAIVVENKYIEATFVPGYGGRLLSLIYKPTGNDLLYTNPTGTPYGFSNTPPGEQGTSPFYHNWLMVWGGIFPTVTQAEHGKYWFLPWDYSIEETEDEVAITMTKTDDLDYADAPGNYTYGKTGLETSVTYTMSKTSPAVDMSVSIHNPTDETQEYEYWTCTTLAPGAASDAGSPTMEIVSPVSTIQRESWYPWMDDVEEPANPETPNDRYKKLDKLEKMVNWESDGIAYGQGLADNPQGDWWGVINQENGEGIVRVGDNDVTPGMKFWEWGYENSFDTNIFANGDSARPYIELWAGVSNKFFEAKTIEPGATTSWTETYLPTMDLANLTNANENGSAEISFSGSGDNTTVRGDVFSTRVGEELQVRLVDVGSGDTLATESFVAQADESTDLTAPVGADATVRLEVLDSDGEVVLSAERDATS